MKNFILLNFMCWFLITTIPLRLYNSDEPDVKHKLVEKMIELTKQSQSGCEKAYIFFNPQEENPNLINVIIECYKWEI